MSAKTLVRGALIAAVYTVLTLSLAPFSFGPVQLRVAEALTLLVVVCPEAVVGVTLGCFLSNLFASAPLDVAVGTAATLLAALLSRKWRGVRLHGLPLLAALPPVVFNALFVGAELTWLYAPGAGPGVWLFNMLTVGAGELASCALGVALVWLIEENPGLKRLFAE